MILVLGGTSDSLVICDYLNKNNKEFILSVTTDYGKEISCEYAKNIYLGKLDVEALCEFIKVNNINLIIDATHPYAAMASENSISASEKLKIKYIRYERKNSYIEANDRLIKVDSVDKACEVATEIGNKIFLATGSKNLSEFVKQLKDKELIARILPTSGVVKSCEDMGLSAHNIIGMKGPFTYDMNKALYTFYGVDCVITKESGKEGGFVEKIDSALDLGLKVIVITRPAVNYPSVIRDVIELNLEGSL